MTGDLGKQPKTKAYLLKTQGPTLSTSWHDLSELLSLEQAPRIKQPSFKDQSMQRDLLSISQALSLHIHCQIQPSVWRG